MLLSFFGPSRLASSVRLAESPLTRNRVVDGNAGEELERRRGDKVVPADAADGRVGIEAWDAQICKAAQ